MFKVALRSALGHKVRFLLTCLAVVLGVGFVAGTFVLSDSVRSTFDSIATASYKNISVVVRGQKALGQGEMGDSRSRLPMTLVDTLKTVDGVATAKPVVSGTALLVGRDGTAVRGGGGPGLARASDSVDNGSFVVTQGVLPSSGTDIAVEKNTLELSTLAVGDTTKVLVAGEAKDAKVVGEVTFAAESLAGSTVLIFPPDTARTYFSPDGAVDSFEMTAAAGVSDTQLRDRVAEVLPANAEAVTGEQAVDDLKEMFAPFSKGINYALLMFAGVSLFVCAFIIFNTFSMTVAQRTRELALLRAMGASRRQVTRSVLLEALLVGILGSVLGLFTGLGLAALLKLIIAKSGIDIAGGLPLHARTIIICFIVGIILTVISAYFPARRAAVIPPVAAMRDDATLTERSLHRRTLFGGIITALGVGLLVLALFGLDGKTSATALGVSAGIVLIGAAILAPIFVAPFSLLFSGIYRKVFGPMGTLAYTNARRNARRTTITAAALMVGVTVVTAITLLASSAKATIDSALGDRFTGDFVLTGGGTPIPLGAVARVKALPQTDQILLNTSLPMSVNGTKINAGIATPESLRANVRVSMEEGALESLQGNTVLIDDEQAEKSGWKVGQTITADAFDKKGLQLVVGGIYAKDDLMLSRITVSQELYEKTVPEVNRVVFATFVKLKPNADKQAAQQALTDAVKPLIVVTVMDADQWGKEASKQLNIMLGIIYSLLALAILIAILGIINTLALSVFERTREIGLLRAVGMTRRQLRRVIRLESIIITLFGTALGVGIGLLYGIMVQRKLAESGLDQLAIPWVLLASLVVLAVLVGILAAWWPSRRAAKLNVLRAITTE